ncbi:MAG: sulfotransferase, partial [Methylococcaceae bacterium]|nr:sulfotransferase [Methylococcaceae bacterium]
LLNWQNTAGFYALTMDWWLHFKQLTTMDFIEFRYEDAVTDFEGTYRQVFDFLGLDWHPDVINFHQSAAKKHIVSPSFNQVTQPLYATSVARWQRYQSEFTSISPLLEPYISIFGYKAIN